MAASLSSARRVPRSLLPEKTVLHSAPVHVHICLHLSAMRCMHKA